MGGRIARRDFLKTSAAGTAGLLATSAPRARTGSVPGGAWSPGMQINPDIDNLRVAVCHDPDMLTERPLVYVDPLEDQNKVVKAEVVRANMDQMAMVLAQKNSPEEAWRTIFRKPENKTWAQVKVAIKPNCLATTIMPKVAIIRKLIDVLHGFGIPYDNIVIYDGGSSGTRYSDAFDSSFPAEQLPQGVQMSEKDHKRDNGFNLATIPTSPGDKYLPEQQCTNFIQDGSTDILINCAVSKHNSRALGGPTLSLKNHYGTFVPRPRTEDNGDGTFKTSHAANSDGLEYLLKINQSDAIIGGNPPRQQLVIVDSLISLTTGPTDGTSDDYVRNDRLIMGTFGPAVDFLVTRKIRGDIMDLNKTENELKAQNRWLTGFDYSEQDIDDILNKTPDQNGGRGWVEVTPASQVAAGRSPVGRNTAIRTVTFTAPGRLADGVKLEFRPQKGIDASTLSIHDMRGRLVRRIPLTGKDQTVMWDGLTDSGATASSGRYILRVGQSKMPAMHGIVSIL